MVLSERGVQDIRSGRRSRAASPNNGHQSDESSATDESEYCKIILSFLLKTFFFLLFNMYF